VQYLVINKSVYITQLHGKYTILNYEDIHVNKLEQGQF
jgi:hypothetical protein